MQQRDAAGVPLEFFAKPLPSTRLAVSDASHPKCRLSSRQAKLAEVFAKQKTPFVRRTTPRPDNT